ncbi:MAG: RsmE family RNA methyltransferase [Balneolaceae bacterium]
MNLFYADPADVHLPVLTLRNQEAKHVTKVMRYREGDELFATDGKGTLYKTEIIYTGRDHVELRVTESTFEEPEEPWVTICIGLLKKRDRLEFAVEKTVELGVNEIIIFKGDHSQKENIRLDRLEAAVLSAMKQSRRLYLPEVSLRGSLEESIGTETGHNISVVVADETTENSRMNNRLKEKIILVVGPEGGFSEEERRLFKNLKPQFYSLGSKRLRTETAAIVMADHFRR